MVTHNYTQKLSKREKELNDARFEGQQAYYNRANQSCPDYDGDRNLQAAWKDGYNQSKEMENW